MMTFTQSGDDGRIDSFAPQQYAGDMRVFCNGAEYFDIVFSTMQPDALKIPAEIGVEGPQEAPDTGRLFLKLNVIVTIHTLFAQPCYELALLLDSMCNKEHNTAKCSAQEQKCTKAELKFKLSCHVSGPFIS